MGTIEDDFKAIGRDVSDLPNQSIARAATLLRVIAALHGGRRLVDIVASSGLSKATAHRMLQALEREDLVRFDTARGLWHLGLGLVALGAAAGNRYGLREAATPAMARLAERTGDTIYLSLREGFEALCLDRREGSFPIRTLTLAAGDRRPLGIGAGSLAMLAFLPPEETDAAISAVVPRLRDWPGIAASDLHAWVAESRRLGYALNDNQVLLGMSAVGAPILGPDGRPIAAISVAAICQRMTAPRRAEIVTWLKAEAEALSARLVPHLASPQPARRRRRA